MKRNWLLLPGVLLAGAGSLLTWLDIGDPSTGNTLLWAGILLIAWNLLRRGGG